MSATWFELIDENDISRLRVRIDPPPATGAVTSVTAADASVVIGGTAEAPTIRTATLDELATLHPPVAAIDFSSQPLAHLADGIAADDAAAFGQTPAGGALVTAAEMSSGAAAAGDVPKADGAGGVAYGTPATGAVTRICDSVAGATVASFDTNTLLSGDIPQTYNHLLILMSVRNDAGATSGLVYLRFNGDTGGNYDYEMVHASGTTVVVSQIQGGFQMAAGRVVGGGGPANSFAAVEMFIADYTSAAHSKAVVASSTSREASTAGGIHRESDAGVWFATPAAVTRITVFSSDGTGFVAGSRFTLYGLS